MNILFLVAGLLALVGLVGIFLPAVPGLPLIFLGMLLAAWADHFQHISWYWLVMLGILTIFSFGVDFLAVSMGAKRVGASKLALVGAVIGTFVGIFAGPVGLFVGPFIGALVGELINRRDLRQATKVGLGTTLGMLLGVVLKIGLAFAMIGLFAFAWYTGA